jgi:hypothetical protein
MHDQAMAFQAARGTATIHPRGRLQAHITKVMTVTAIVLHPGQPFVNWNGQSISSRRVSGSHSASHRFLQARNHPHFPTLDLGF